MAQLGHNALMNNQALLVRRVDKRRWCEGAVIQKGSQSRNVTKWKHFPPYWPFVRGIHWLPMNSPHKGQWRRALIFSLICARTNRWANTRDAGDLRRHRAHYDVTVMGNLPSIFWICVKDASIRCSGTFLLPIRHAVRSLPKAENRTIIVPTFHAC